MSTTSFLRRVVLGLIALVAVLAVLNARADATYVYAVQISAVIQTNPPRITLTWEPDPFGATNYMVYRKALNDTSWGAPVASLDGSALAYTDTAVSVGAAYEYQIVKAAKLGYTGYGYIYSGINAPLIENRGTLLLVVATNNTASLSNELAQLQSDLVGDGWLVHRHDVSSNDTPAGVRAVITNEYYADPVNVNAVFLFGHVPILQSGNLNYDGHLTRPMPADAYYGEMNNDWPTNPATSPSFLPSPVKLEVGRVDMFNMPGVGAPVPWPSEVELLRRYLNKDHKWRTKQIAVQRRALVGDTRGVLDGDLATAASGYRNFEPFVGPGNTYQAAVAYGSPLDQRWISLLSAGSYLCAYGNGGGNTNACGGLGTNVVAGSDSILFSTDVVAQDAQAVFVMLFGSWFGEWDGPDDLMRSFLATPTMGLACCLSGEPHWFIQHMGLGETIGYGARLTMNNTTLYQNMVNSFTQAVYIALMGDPTLRLDPVAPPSSLNAVPGSGSVALNWSPSTDAVAGYHVYRANPAAGPFTRLTSALLTTTNFTDTTVSPGTYTYMVRAVALQTTPSGSYFNPSQGIFSTTIVPVPPLLAARLATTPSTLLLSWTSQPGVAYHVQARPAFTFGAWSNWSGSITASTTTTTFTDTNIAAGPSLFYRISTP